MDMKKSFNYSSIAIVLLAVAVMVMSVGYANFTSQLNITGTTNVGMSSWKISFDEGTYALGSQNNVTVPESNVTFTEGTSMSYTVSLTKPGDVYDFTIDVKNSGTFDAYLTAITLSPLTAAQQKYLVYEVYYNNTLYTSTTTGLETLLGSGKTATVNVRVKYIQPDSAGDLPSEAQEITLTASLDYAQELPEA